MADDLDQHPEDEVIQSEAERFLFAEFTIGADVEDFLRTETGRYLQGVAQQEIGEAIRTFLNSNPRRSADQVAQAHASATQARQAFQWMLEAIQSGRAAEFRLREMDDLEERS